MRITFEATQAGFDADKHALVCGMSGADESGKTRYLVLQRDAEESSEDWGVHLEYDDQSNGDYGCVSACRLSRVSLHVDLSRQLGRLAGVTGFDISLRLDNESYESLQHGLPRVFRGMAGALEFA